MVYLHSTSLVDSDDVRCSGFDLEARATWSPACSAIPETDVEADTEGEADTVPTELADKTEAIVLSMEDEPACIDLEVCERVEFSIEPEAAGFVN